MTKKIIGVVGEKGGGKGAFVKILQEIVGESQIMAVKSSDILADTLKIWNLPLSRHNLQQLAITMKATFGDTALSDAVKNRIDASPTQVVIYEGIRWPSDIEMIRSFPESTLVYVTAPVEMRYKRTLVRGEKVGEDKATLEDFIRDEQVATETQITKIAASADVKIENIGTAEDLREKVIEFAKKMNLR